MTLEQNLIWNKSIITRDHRKNQNGHKSIVLWFTGLSGSGNSTLAHILEDKLFQLGYRTFVLDGDNVRHGLCSDLGFNDSDRKENIRRISKTGTIVMTAFISPFKKDREIARKIFNKGDFTEIYCKASLETCEKRDLKGLYKRARSGEIKNYTGINSPYEIPINPELTIDTEQLSIEESINRIIQFIDLLSIIEVND